MIPGITYLNWAGLAPLTLQSYLQSLVAPELMGNILLPNWVQRVDKLRENVAVWLGCHSDQVAFVPSTSVALTIAAQCFTLAEFRTFWSCSASRARLGATLG